MANLKEVRTRISSVKSTQQITAAMKMVAASKLRRAQNAIIRLRPYATKLQDILKDLSGSMSGEHQGVFAIERDLQRVLILPITSNRGLCGGFNANVIKATLHLVNQVYKDPHEEGNLSLITIGRKASDYFYKRQYPVIEQQDDLFDNLSFDHVVPLADKLMEAYAMGEYDRIILVYNQFKNAATQRVVTEPYLPVVSTSVAGDLPLSSMEYILEPPRDDLARELFPKMLRIQLYKALLDSYAAEHGARMTAMHQATDNAKELLKQLQLTYNKARQAAITNEILEIVSGANALQDS